MLLHDDDDDDDGWKAILLLTFAGRFRTRPHLVPLTTPHRVSD